MYVYRLMFSVIFVPIVFTSNSRDCFWLGLKGISCGTFLHPNCKFKAEYITIKPDGIDIGFGDAYFDTHDVDVQLSCSFRTPIEGNYTIAIMSYEKGWVKGRMNAFDRFYKWINKNDSGNGTIVAWKHGNVGQHKTIDTNATLLSIKQKAGTTYTCICPDIQYEKVKKGIDSTSDSITYLKPIKVLSTYAGSSSFYQVPVYAPCEIETCNKVQNYNRDYCYETKTGPNLGDMDSQNVDNLNGLVTYCADGSSVIKKNWITDKWTEQWKDRFINLLLQLEPSVFQQMYILVSKHVLDNVCSQMIDVGQRWFEGNSVVMNQWQIFSQIPEMMRNNYSFPWFQPDEDELGSLLLPYGYLKDPQSNLIANGKRYPRCSHHFDMLQAMMDGSTKTHAIHKFFTKTYPSCLFLVEEQRHVKGETWFELYFNKVAAYYDSKHLSLGEEENVVLLKTLPQNTTYKEKYGVQRIYRYKTVDCSLYSWKKSEGIESYFRLRLELKNRKYENKTRRSTASGSLVFEYRINASIIEKYGDEYKIMIGCYVQYEVCETKSCGDMNINVTEKMQFYVQPQSQMQIVPQYSNENKLIACNSVDQTLKWTAEDYGNETCACICEVFLCSPLKTRQLVNKTFDCDLPFLSTSKTTEAKKLANKDYTMMTVGLLVLAGLMFITGIIISVVFCNKKSNRGKKEEVRVLTLINTEESPNEISAQPQNGEFFDTETMNSSNDPSRPTSDGSKPMTDVNGDKSTLTNASTR